MDHNPVCTSCKKMKNRLAHRKSKVLPGVSMYLCETCINEKREPRGFLVVAGRQMASQGVSPTTALRPWIVNHRYVGDPITAAEWTA